MATLLEVKGLTTQFFTQDGIVRAVNGISYTLDEGETLGIVGESGSGKSVGVMSLIRLIPSPPGKIVNGEVIFEGQDLLKISDDGRGIDAKTLKQIFDPFFTTKRNQGGTGLGLSIAYGIIKEHKGRIEVESKLGSGTTFSVTIPVSQKENP